MVATMLPMLIDLDKHRRTPATAPVDAARADKDAAVRVKNARDSMVNRHVVVCRMLRQLAGPPTSEIGQDESLIMELLMELPQEAMSLGRWLQALDTASQRLDVHIDSIGPYKDLAYLRRVAHDKLSGWKTAGNDRQAGGSSRKGAKNLPLPLYSEVAKQASTKVYFEDADGRSHQLRHYVAQSVNAESHDEALDPDLKAERPQTESTMTLDTDRSLEYYLQNRGIWTSTRSKYFSQAIAMDNQHLPITALTVSGCELRHFLQCIGDRSRAEWGVVPKKLRTEVAAWGGFRFFLSRGPEELRKLRFPEKPKRDDTLGELVGASSVASALTPPPQAEPTSADQPATAQTLEGLVAKGTVMLRSPSPEHAPPKASGKTVSVASLYKLGLPQFMSSLIGVLNHKRLNLFGQQVDYEGHFKDLLNEINRRHQVELTAHKLELAMAERMSQLALSDWVIGNYFKGASPNSHIPSVYSCVPVSQIQNAFNEACSYFQAESEVVIIQCDIDGSLGLSDGNESHVGSLHFPTLSHVQATVQTMVFKLREYSSLPGVNFVELHNLYTAFCVMSYMATCGALGRWPPVPI